ncbi:MAG: hypothetical protein AAF511_08170 [Pseudomonadota bacterium]
MSTPYNDQEIESIAKRLLDRSLPKAEWTHAAHWAAALRIAKTDARPFETIAAAIPPYNEAVGGQNTDTDGYHATVTYACMTLAELVMAEADDDISLSQIHRTVMTSPLGDMDWLKRHYSTDRLWSVKARREPLEPDLAPLKDTLQDVTHKL